MLKTLFRDLILALGFLTRLPLPPTIFTRNADMSLAQSSGAFPLAGLVIGLIYAIPALVLAQIFPVAISIIIAIALRIIVTGALHEDGLADVADGFWGGKTIERRLEIMKDSSVGTYGALALILAIALEALCLNAIWQNHSAYAFFAAIIAASVISRSAMVWHWNSLPNARKDGVAVASGHPETEQRNKAMAIGATIALLAILSSFSFVALGLVAIIMLGKNFGIKQLCIDKIGGCTGDTIGATQRIVEVSVLLALALNFA